MKNLKGFVIGALLAKLALTIAIGLCILLAGCATTSTPDTRTFLGTSHLQVNPRTHLTPFGASIDDYTCGEHAVMWCESRDGLALDCACYERGF